MAANVAVGARRLGTASRLVAAVGDDATGREALAALEAGGVDPAFVATRPGEPTFFCVILVSDEGEKSLVKVLSPAYLPQPDDLRPAALEGVSHVHLTFTRRDLAERAIGLARTSGASVSLDLEAADLPGTESFVADLIGTLDILFLSEASRRALEAITGPLGAVAPPMVLTTRGRDGATLERRAGRHEVAGHAVRVVDTSGAGDAFAAGFLHAWLGGEVPERALAFANAAAALSTRAYGAQAGLPTAAEVESFLARAAQE